MGGLRVGGWISKLNEALSAVGSSRAAERTIAALRALVRACWDVCALLYGMEKVKWWDFYSANQAAIATKVTSVSASLFFRNSLYGSTATPFPSPPSLRIAGPHRT
jgi:hypothetical protein